MTLEETFSCSCIMSSLCASTRFSCSVQFTAKPCRTHPTTKLPRFSIFQYGSAVMTSFSCGPKVKHCSTFVFNIFFARTRIRLAKTKCLSTTGATTTLFKSTHTTSSQKEQNSHPNQKAKASISVRIQQTRCFIHIYRTKTNMYRFVPKLASLLFFRFWLILYSDVEFQQHDNVCVRRWAWYEHRQFKLTNSE